MAGGSHPQRGLVCIMINIPDSIFPKDSSGHPICPKCAKLLKDCDCPSGESPKAKKNKLAPVVRLDKSGRKGKIVTLIESLPRNEVFLKGLAKRLKTKTGSGGTFYFNERGGVIELQGDHQDIAKQMLNQ